MDSTGAQYRDAIRTLRLVDELGRTPFSHVIVQIRAYGDAYYLSSIVPAAWGLEEKFDPLAELLKGLHGGKNPKKVYVWLDLFRVGSANRAVPVSPKHVTAGHADWLTRNSSFKTEDEGGNQYLEPGLEEVQDHLDAVVTELVTKYQFDGIVFDDLRYPGLGSDWGYHTKMLDAWRAKTGRTDQPKPDDAAWSDLRREALAKCLRRLTRAAKKARPDVQVGAIALADGPAPKEEAEFASSLVYAGAMQDWPSWMKDKSVDFLVLRNFRSEGAAAAEFDAWNRLAGQVVQNHGGDVISAIAGYENISLDALAQMRRAKQNGLAGVALYQLREPIQDATARELFFRALAKTVLAPGAQRQPIPPFEVAAAEPAPAPFPPVTSESNPPPEKSAKRPPVETPPPPPAEAPDGGRPVMPKDDLNKLMQEAPGRPAKTDASLIQPSLDALQYLKRKYPNIF